MPVTEHDPAPTSVAALLHEGPPAPRWLETGLAAVLALLAGFGLVGLALAVAGLFLPVLVVPWGAVISAVLFRTAVHGRADVTAHEAQPRRSTRTATPAAAGALALAIGSAVFNVSHDAQHVLIDRDPGAYIATGRWLATHHSLVFRADPGPFHHVPGLYFSSPAIYGHGRTHFQFSHLLGVLLAEARWVGGDHFMFALTPLLGALSILLFYAFATRLVRPVFALVAATALAVNVVQVHFSRDAYSEILQQLVLLGSLWLVSSARLDARRALFAGVLLGSTVAARVDGPLYLAAIPVLVGLVVARSRDGRARADADGIGTDTVGPFVLGVAIVTLLAIADVWIRVPEYARYIGLRVVLQYVGLAAATGIAVLLGRSAHRWHRRATTRRWLPTAAGAVVAAALFAMWFIRPYVQTVRGKQITLVEQIQRLDHLASDPSRHYYESSLRWHAWYLGPPLLLVAIVGVAYAIRSTLRHGSIGRWLLLTTFGATGAVYLWNANITPDQLWIMRRYLPIGIPAFVLFAVMVMQWIASRYGRVGVSAAVVLAVAAIAWPLSATLPVRDETTQPGMLGAINATCRALGPHAAVIVARGSDAFHVEVPQTLRSFCEVPVAQAHDSFDPAGYSVLARRWKAAGRTLQIVGDTPESVAAVLPGLRPRVIASVTNRRALEQTLDRPPRHYTTTVFSFAIATVPLTTASS
jgi:hypothetical protein